MADKTTASQCWILLSVCFLVSASDEVKNIKAKPGEDVILPCRAPSNISIKVVEWVREDGSLCLNRDPGQDDRCETDSRLQSFKGRVQLNNSWVKNGNLSLILKSVNISDSGRYECRVAQTGAKRRKRAGLDTESINIINLTVEPGHDVAEENRNGNYGLTIGLPVVAVLLSW